MNTKVNIALVFALLYGSAMCAMDDTQNPRFSLILSSAEFGADKKEFESLSALEKQNKFIDLKIENRILRTESENRGKLLVSERKTYDALLNKARSDRRKALWTTGIITAGVTVLATVGIMAFLQNKSVSVPSK